MLISLKLSRVVLAEVLRCTWRSYPIWWNSLVSHFLLTLVKLNVFLTRLLPGLGGGFNERGVVEYKEYKDDDDEYDDFGRRKKKKGESSAPQASRPMASPPKAAPKEVIEDEEEEEEAGLKKKPG